MVPDYGRRHLLIGWWSLCVFAAAGLALEVLLAFKLPLYVDVSNDTRRLVWRLAHAHGTLLGLVNLAFGLLLHALPGFGLARQHTVSAWLRAATALVPGGFFLSGITFYSGDPGLGVVLVPAGAVCFILAAALTAREISAVPTEGSAAGRARRPR